MSNVNGQWVRVNNIRSVTGSEWNNYFRVRYGSENVHWMQAPRIMNVNGKQVILNDNLFDPTRIDSRGRTNLQRMEQGLAPIGHDGKSINIHHMDQTDIGPVMEISATEHQLRYSEIHSNTGQMPSQIDRPAFDRWRREYWQWRRENNLE